MAEAAKAEARPGHAPDSVPRDPHGNTTPLFDRIDTNKTPDKSAGSKPGNKKTTNMEAKGVKPLTALAPILGILGLVIALVLWRVSPTAAIIVGLIALAILALWVINRRARRRGQRETARHQPSTPHRPYGRRATPHDSHGWRSRWRHGSREGSSPHRGGRTHESQRHGSRFNPFSQNQERSRRGLGSGSRGQPQRRRSRWPFGHDHDRSRGDRQSSAPRGTRGTRTSRNWRDPFGGGRSRRRRRPSHHGSESYGDGHSGGSHGDSSRRRRRQRPWSGRNRRHHDGTHGRGHGHDRRPWYKPWSRRNRHHGGSNDEGESASHGNDGNGRGRGRRFRRLWKWRLYDSESESVNGHHDPGRRGKFRDRWNTWRTRRQRESVNYAGFEVDSDGNAKPHWNRWKSSRFWDKWNAWRDRKHRSHHDEAQGQPVHATATRVHSYSPRADDPVIGHSVLGLGTGSRTHSTENASSSTLELVPEVNQRSRIMAHNSGPAAMDAVGGRLESETYAAGAAGSHASSVWHIAVGNRLREWAHRLASSSNPYHRAAAQGYMVQAARAYEVAEGDAKLAATQMEESNRALNGSQ